jgi:hypothetical protein
MWEAVDKLHRDAYENFERHHREALIAHRNHRILGFCVVVITAVVGSSVFATLSQDHPSAYVQLATGLLSILATVLSAIQTFFGFSDATAQHKAASVGYYMMKRRTEVFLDKYRGQLTDRKQRQAEQEQDELIEEFTEIRGGSPIARSLR